MSALLRLFTLWFEWKQRIRYAADTEERTLLASSGYSPKWRYTESEETNCWIKSLFLFSLHRKSVLIASLYSDWTTDGRWTILMMLFFLFWALTVLFTWKSMGQSQTSRFSKYLKNHFTKYLILCSEDEQSFYGFGTTWGKWLMTFWGGVTL